MNIPKKICLISPSLQLGGLERAMSTLANYFCSEGHEVHYIVLYNFDKFYKLDDRITFIEPDFSYHKTSKVNYYFKLIPYLRRTVKSINPDTILSFGDYHNALVLFSLQGLEYPVFVSDRSSPNKNFGRLFPYLKKWMYKKSAGVIAQTERAALQKRKMLGKKVPVTIIPNALRDIKLPDVERKNIILGVGRHYYVKGLDRLINAFALINTDWKLLIAGGKGPETQRLYELVNSHGLSNQITFLGDVSDVEKLYAEAGMFVLASRSEGYPNALCEAMASGLACISFDIVAGPADIITDGENGLLVEDDNIELLANKIQYLINNQDVRSSLGYQALKVQDKLSLNRTGRRFMDVITKTINDEYK